MTTADIESKMDIIQSWGVRKYGGGVGVQYREDRPGDHSMTLYHSSHKTGNTNLYIAKGSSYAEVFEDMYKYVERNISEESSPPVEPRLLEPRLNHQEPGVYYAYTENGEDWFGKCPTIRAAYEEARQEFLKAENLWVAKHVCIDTLKLLPGIQHQMIESAADAAGEIAGSAAEGWLEEINPSALQELGKSVSQTFHVWLVEHKLLPTFFGVEAHHHYFPVMHKEGEEP
jgi:hypothetical protein